MIGQHSPNRSRRVLLVALLAAGAVSGSANTSHADQPLAPAAGPAPWYGWQNAIVDVGAASLFVAGVVRHQPSLFWVGGVSSIFGSSLVHVAHRNFTTALGSTGLRGLVLGAAFGGTALAELLTCDPNENAHAADQCRDRGRLGVSSVAVAITAIFDDAMLARSRPAATPPPLLPSVSVARPPGRGAAVPTFGFSGVF